MPTFRVTRDMVQWCDVDAANADEARRLARDDAYWQDEDGPGDDVDAYRVEAFDDEEDAQ
jgi:hypothetical protein